MKLSKTIDEYEKVISELRAEQRTLSKENRNLKDIIVKLEHSKLKEMETARNLDIYLGKSMNTGGKEDRQLERRRLLPGTHKNEGHPNHQKQPPNSNHFLANPLFRQLSGDYENIGDTGGSRTTDLRLKEKLCYDTIKTINTQSIVYQDPGFYIRETKTYHNANLNGMKYIASSGGGSARKIVKDESEINSVKNLERAMKSLNKGPMPLERVINSPSQQEGALISSESSETSLVSCLSHLNPETGANFKRSDDILASEIEKHNARPKVNSSSSSIVLRQKLLWLLYGFLLIVCLTLILAMIIL